MRLFLPALVVVGLFAGCDDGAKPVAPVAAPVVIPAPVVPVAPAAPAGQFVCCADERDTKVVSDYLAVQTALAKDDDAGAVSALAALATSVGFAQVGSTRHE